MHRLCICHSSSRNPPRHLIYENGGNQKGYPPFFILKMLSRKLYMKKIAPPQMRTVTCCILGSEMRGTLRASAIVAKERNPSGYY